MSLVRVVAVSGLVVLCAGGCTDDDDHPEPDARPSPEVGAPARAVGGGETTLTAGEEALVATEVDATDLSALAAEPDGTLWLVHAGGDVFRVDPEGELTHAAADVAPSLGGGPRRPSTRTAGWSS